MNLPHSPKKTQRTGFGSKAFSLLEMIAVLAIIAVVAALLLPGLFKRFDAAARTQEVANLAAFREALLLNVLRSNSIPDHTGWQQASARWSAFPISQVATNARRYQRLYFLRSGSSPGLIYSQTPNGTGQPAGLQAIVVSILGGDPLTFANCPNPAGGYLSAVDFDALWNNPDGARPTTGLWANWNGKSDDFLAQRVDYAPLFHRLVLVNRDPASPSFTINESSPIVVTNNPINNAGWNAYYLTGSVVGLCDTTGTPMTRYVLQRDIGFVFEHGIWRDAIMGLNTGNNLADDFGNLAAAFLGSPWNPGAFQGADQQGALITMYSFMYTYILWANQCPHFPTHNISSAQQVPEYMMLQSVADPNKTLDQVTGDKGLLKK